MFIYYVKKPNKLNNIFFKEQKNKVGKYVKEVANPSILL